jgi:hypothetical protein
MSCGFVIYYISCSLSFTHDQVLPDGSLAKSLRLLVTRDPYGVPEQGINE